MRSPSLPGDEPLVSIVTPVYNGADFLDACIQSVLLQTYENYEYIVVNNCSTDRTLEIARSYARKDSRITVHDNSTFVGVIENHNLAFSLISPKSKYCKVVSADDWIFPECLTRMVTLAEANPSVAMVGAYMLAGKQVMNAGLEYERRVVKGRDICRATLLGGPYVFGSPTSLLYRSDLVRKKEAFYPNPNPHSDTTACYELLKDWDFGFVHQVLAYAQVHAESQTSRSIKYGTIRRALIADLTRFGPVYLTPDELEKRLTHLMDYYYRWLVGAIVANRRDPDFWRIQRAELEDVGIRVTYAGLGKAALRKAIGILFRPREAMERVLAISRRDPHEIEAQYY
jgi:glycosyltransferase involved in cell wall biosynthesis